MEGWVVFATVVTAFAGLVAAGAAIWLAVLNRQLVRASHEQVRASQDEVKASLEQVSSQHRPVLVPKGSPRFQEENSNWLAWGANEQPIIISNLGTGVAFNVASVLYGCASYVHDSSAGHMRSSDAAHEHWTLWLGTPIAPGESSDRPVPPYRILSNPHKKGYGTFLDGNNRIGDYPFNAPDEQPVGATAMQGELWRVARITITYHDITGRKYASIFDYVHNRGWHMFAILPDIERDLHDLEGYYRDVPVNS